MSNCIILHGGPLNIAESEPHTLHTLYWFPWVAQALEKQSMQTFVPALPHPWSPVYSEYKEVFEQLPVSKETVLVGHSRGCTFAVRWLSETRQSVKKLIMVAPSFIPSGDNEKKKTFYSFDIDSTIKDRVHERVIFTSDTEDEDGKQSATIVNAKLDCEIISLSNHGHYITEEMPSNEFPELVNVIMR